MNNIKDSDTQIYVIQWTIRIFSMAYFAILIPVSIIMSISSYYAIRLNPDFVTILGALVILPWLYFLVWKFSFKRIWKWSSYEKIKEDIAKNRQEKLEKKELLEK